MSMDSLVKKLPDYALEVKKNLSEIFLNKLDSGIAPLSKQQIFSVALSVGYSLRHEQLLNHIRGEAKIHIEDTLAQASKVAAIIATLRGTYIDFAHYVDDKEIKNLADNDQYYGIKSMLITTENNNFKMCCLAISILNRHEYCSNLYINSLLKDGVTREEIIFIAKIVTTLRATRDALEIERLRSYEFAAREFSIE
ncbi:MAG: carboxymuconolactone decarboxylase family protein [Proteobacteria bacterium]|nr:carboxymuconolactone decarboxylase family protein [Pseudomonadota bacterium]